MRGSGISLTALTLNAATGAAVCPNLPLLIPPPKERPTDNLEELLPDHTGSGSGLWQLRRCGPALLLEMEKPT